MATYRTRIESPLTREEAFDYLSDFRNAAEWDSNTVSSVCLGDDPQTVGARFEVVTGFGGRNLTLIYETIEFDRPDRVVFRSDTAISSIQDTIVFESAGEGSVVDYEARITMKGPAKLLDPVFGLIFGPVGDRAAAGLRKALKAE
jgi:hypothetical protein